MLTLGSRRSDRLVLSLAIFIFMMKCEFLPVFSFERMSKYNLIRGEAFVGGECISVIEDSGFTNVEHVITELLLSLSDDIPRPIKVQIKITNLDKRQIQLYQRTIR